jgi:energy-coupling factor transport system substrate-specific component
MTRQRDALLALLGQVNDFRSAQDLHLALRQRSERVGLTTVYRTLAALHDAGEVDAMRDADGEVRYRRCTTEDHHHHLVCRVCGRTVEVASPPSTASVTSRTPSRCWAAATGASVRADNRRNDRGAPAALRVRSNPQTLEPDLGNASAGSRCTLRDERDAYVSPRASAGIPSRPREEPMSSTTTHTTATAASRQWRTVDIVVTAVIAVAGGVVFWAFSLLTGPLGTASAAFPPVLGLTGGIWLLPAVAAPLIVRKPGAALMAELIAALVEALLGNQWGLANVYYGLFEGLGAELGFLLLAYRQWGRGAALLAGALAGVAETILDVTTYYPDWSIGWKAAYAAMVVPSGALLAGLGSWLLVRSLARTGVLAPFAAGR